MKSTSPERYSSGLRPNPKVGSFVKNTEQPLPQGCGMSEFCFTFPLGLKSFPSMHLKMIIPLTGN